MQGSRNIDILMHIKDYCAEINHTMDTFGRDYDIFVSNFIYEQLTVEFHTVTFYEDLFVFFIICNE